MQVTPHQARQTYAAQLMHSGAKREHAGEGLCQWLLTMIYNTEMVITVGF